MGRIKKSKDYGQVLMWAAVMVSAPRWAGAMLAADLAHVEGTVSTLLNGANVVSGLGMGLLEVLAMAYMLDALRGLKPFNPGRNGNKGRVNYRFWGTAGFAFGLLALTPFVLAPYLVARMNGVDIGTVLQARAMQFVWAVAVVMAPVFVVGGVAFARPGLVGFSTPQEGINSQGAMQAASQVAGASQGASKPAKPYRVCECGYRAMDRFAWAAHRKACKVKTNRDKRDDFNDSVAVIEEVVDGEV